MPVNEIIKNRKSIRKYDNEKQVTREQIELLLEAGMLAPSACNAKPYRFIAVTNKEKLQEITKVHEHSAMLNTATAAIVVIADTSIVRSISEGFFPQDCAAVTENILLQATSLGLGSCWCGVYPKEEKEKAFKRLFNLSDTEIAFSLIAIGYPAEEFGSRGKYDAERITWVD